MDNWIGIYAVETKEVDGVLDVFLCKVEHDGTISHNELNTQILIERPFGFDLGYDHKTIVKVDTEFVTITEVQQGLSVAHRPYVFSARNGPFDLELSDLPPIREIQGLLPPAGTTGQILAKKSNTNYDTEWVDAPSGGGSGTPGREVPEGGDPGDVLTREEPDPDDPNAPEYRWSPLPPTPTPEDSELTRYVTPHLNIAPCGRSMTFEPFNPSRDVGDIIYRENAGAGAWLAFSRLYVMGVKRVITADGFDTSIYMQIYSISTPGSGAPYTQPVFSPISRIDINDIPEGIKLTSFVRTTGTLAVAFQAETHANSELEAGKMKVFTLNYATGDITTQIVDNPLNTTFASPMYDPIRLLFYTILNNKIVSFENATFAKRAKETTLTHDTSLRGSRLIILSDILYVGEVGYRLNSDLTKEFEPVEETLNFDPLFTAVQYPDPNFFDQYPADNPPDLVYKRDAEYFFEPDFLIADTTFPTATLRTVAALTHGEVEVKTRREIFPGTGVYEDAVGYQDVNFINCYEASIGLSFNYITNSVNAGSLSQDVRDAVTYRLQSQIDTVPTTVSSVAGNQYVKSLEGGTTLDQYDEITVMLQSGDGLLATTPINIASDFKEAGARVNYPTGSKVLVIVRVGNDRVQVTADDGSFDVAGFVLRNY